MKKILLCLLFLSFAIRFFRLGFLPAALNRDEAAIGYNAFSLLKTGKDEHGVSWPLNFQSIGDYKMPGYIYATILPVKFFGLNNFSIRFWSAFAGVMSVVTVYFITKSLAAAALMVFNPWAIFYSRIAFEANLALALFLVGLWLLLKRRWWGYVFWLLAGLTYSSSLIFIPLFIFWLKPKLMPALVFLAAFGYVFINLWTVSSQKANVTVFSDPATIDYYNQTRTKVYEQNPLVARTWWNKNVFFARKIAINYAKTFSPRFLLVSGGGHPWHQIPNMGYFYYSEIFLAVSGLIYLFKTKHSWRWWLLAWLLIAPLASAITIDAPHATRSLFLLPSVIILASFGLPKKKWLWGSLAGLYLINVAFFCYQYLGNYSRVNQQNLPVGLEESIKFVNSKNFNGKIYLTGIADSTYLYPAVYTRFDPAKFQPDAIWTGPDTVGLVNAYQFGQFRVVDDLIDVVNPAALILPSKTPYLKDSAFNSGNYKVILY